MVKFKLEMREKWIGFVEEGWGEYTSIQKEVRTCLCRCFLFALERECAFAQDFGVTHGIESKVGFPSVVCDDPQIDFSSVIKDGWKRDESSGVWYFGKSKH